MFTIKCICGLCMKYASKSETDIIFYAADPILNVVSVNYNFKTVNNIYSDITQ